MSDTPVVMIAGPRQSGKTTLARAWVARGWRYLTLDDELVRLAAREDPSGLIRGHERLVIDEIQRAPGLLLAIKKSVDEDRRPGRFLLTGSANLMTLPSVTESLAGRMEVLTLLPLSQSEMLGPGKNWLDTAFSGQLLQPGEPRLGPHLVEGVLRGGYPEAVERETARRRIAWARQYIDALIARDVKDVAHIDHLDRLPRFLRALAEVAGQLCNYSTLGAELAIDHKTAARYIGVLEQMYLVRRLEPWSPNRLKRLVKTPKLHFIDSGLLCALSGITPEAIETDRNLFGRVLEGFVFAEILKHATTSEQAGQFWYYRDHDKYEVDLVVENAAGKMLAIEVKAAASVSASDLRGLRKFSAIAGAQFFAGLVLYDGLETVRLGERVWAVPIASLWGAKPGQAL
ncbi:MAG: hypothetical protein RIR70_1624 [Pseudomonadota bacterium]